MYTIVRQRSWVRRLTFPVILILGIGLGACSDTTIDPFENDGNYFTVYGFLDETENSHVLRVIPVTRRAEKIMDPADPQGSIDAEVYTTDMNSGVRTRWTHSLEKLSDDSYGHIYRANFLVRAQKTYKLEIIRSDGATTTATTKVPYINRANLFELGPEVFSEDSSLVYMDIKIPEIPSPWEIQAIYNWGGGGIDDNRINRRIFVQYGREGERTSDDGWALRLNISDDQQHVRDNVQESIDNNQIGIGTPVGITHTGLQIRILDQGWDPPNGIFDPEELSEPGKLSNVENGYGYFGSVGLYIQEWNIEHLSTILGYDY